MFGDLQAEIDFSNANNTHIRVRVQANDVTADTNVRVVITAETMARVGSSGNNWTYLVPGRVDDVQPSIGQNGTIVTITGELYLSLSLSLSHTHTRAHTHTHTHTHSFTQVT